MTPFEIPLQPTSQKLIVFLGDVQYQLTLTWCDPAGCWYLDVRDASGTVDVITGIAVVTGADLLEQFGHLTIGADAGMVAETDHDTDAIPTYANLGVAGHLFYVTP